MKVYSLAVAALIGLVSFTQNSNAILIKKEETKKKSIVTIQLKQIDYDNQRIPKDVGQLSQQSQMMLSQALHNTQLGQNKTVSLHQKKQEFINIAMRNIHNMGYEGSFWFGNPSQKMEVIFDTGSAWAWLFSEECRPGQCPLRNKKFEHNLSSEFQQNHKGGQFFTYGKGAVLGHPATDQVCFTEDNKHCLHNFAFLSVVKGKDLESLQGSGLVGLAPTIAKQNELDQPMTNGIPGFIAQLRNSTAFQSDFDPIFSIYLSNDKKTPGDISFGGYDLKQFAKQGLGQNDIQWADQASNEAYWSVNSKNIEFGKSKSLVDYNQQLILDNGMSLAMAPEPSFVRLITSLNNDYGVGCEAMRPVWGCSCTKESYSKLPSISFNVIANPEGKTFFVEMPKEAYMRYARRGEDEGCFLLIHPWDFQGIGGKPGEQYWVLGAQFLHHYYTIYDFGQKKIGLIESKTSQINGAESSEENQDQ